MNVLFYTLFPVNPLSGGIERVTFNLCESFRRRGIGVYFICRQGKADNTHFIIPSFDTVVPREFFNAIIEKLHIDIIIDQYGWSSVISHKNIKPEVKIIRCIHHDVEEQFITRRLLGNIGKTSLQRSCKSFLFWLNTPFRRKRFFRGLKNALPDIDRLIVLSPSFIDRLNKRGIISDKVEAIPNWSFNSS
jgi:glycosyltransferase involved in cell wall biosynthesis